MNEISKQSEKQTIHRIRKETERTTETTTLKDGTGKLLQYRKEILRQCNILCEILYTYIRSTYPSRKLQRQKSRTHKYSEDIPLIGTY